MVKTAFTFNGFVKLELTPENIHDKMLLELAFQGREVKVIEQHSDGSIALKILTPEENQQLTRERGYASDASTTVAPGTLNVPDRR